jgi:Putative Flp pilus-assembly TadE/G-like
MLFARFGADRRGGMVVPLALATPVLFGFALVAIDGGRYMNLHTEVQAGTDALALAAAAELDGRPDAIVRANRAVSLVANKHRFGERVEAVSGLEVRYLKSLPARDGDPIGAANLASDAAQARYVEVGARPAAFRSLFAGAAGAPIAPTETTSRAVAGFESLACKTSPLFICNPFERSGTDLFTAMRDPANRRRLIRMKEKETKYFPGNFGYLQPAAGSGADAVRDAMGTAEPKGCYRQSGVEVRTGAVSSTAEAMNTRFDIYDGYFKSAANSPDFRPALNVRKGFASKNADCTGQALAYDPALSPQANMAAGAAAIGLPRDECFYSGTCTFGGSALQGRVGDGRWDVERYWRVNYATTPPNGWSNADPPSRYDVYRHEIESGLRAAVSKGFNPPTTDREIGRPVCYRQSLPAPEEEKFDRRTFYGAILDCQALDDTYSISGSSAPPVPVAAFGRFFVTEPVDKQEGSIWVEVVDIVEPGTSGARGIVQDVIRLYR